MSQAAFTQAKQLFQSHCDGVLSTHSVDLPGYPFGSITPFCFDYDGQAIILISTIAQHTRNIAADNKVSLISYDHQADDRQASGRVTYIADAHPIDDDDVAERYYRFYPQSRGFHKSHDFNFYRLNCVRIRYIGGFGDIHWIERDDFVTANPFSADEEIGMIDHMNTDHQDAIDHYCDLFDIESDQQQPPQLVGIDGEGFHLRSLGRLYRISFEQAVDDAMGVRQAMVALARQEK